MDQCQSSHVVIEPSPVVVTLPGPILSSFPQNTVVGSSTSAAVGSILSSGGVPISSGGFDLSCITNCYERLQVPVLSCLELSHSWQHLHEWQEEAAEVQTPSELASLHGPLELLYSLLPFLPALAPPKVCPSTFSSPHWWSSLSCNSVGGQVMPFLLLMDLPNAPTTKTVQWQPYKEGGEDHAHMVWLHWTGLRKHGQQKKEQKERGGEEGDDGLKL
ncbi:hypothetical protein IHE44_0010202 [Lamprotornis superbus]|uniref:Uncharacterized protein n=1 Tax=Lamprotornis superbus TaxID=245042 RepID=A0A835TLY6_9PASS|nr:hypothetical protein IHE44_0010202 [Lamprotornis superbus]